MRAIIAVITLLISALLAFPLNAQTRQKQPYHADDFANRMPQRVEPSGEKMIIVNPNVHAWGAYDANGYLVRGGIATAGANWCPDLHRRCHTQPGSFRIFSLGNAYCVSHKFPIPRGRAPMPYCMFFHDGQGLHGSHEVADANLSHGCVRLQIEDAKWLRYDFVEGPNEENGYQGTRVIIKPY